MALSKIHRKRKPKPTRLSLAHEINKESSLFDFYPASEPPTTPVSSTSSQTCITPSALSTIHSPNHESVPRNESTITEHDETSMHLTVQSEQVTPITNAQLVTHTDTTTLMTTNRNVLKAIAAITSKQSKSKQVSITNTKPITSYFSTQDHSMASDTTYYGDHSEVIEDELSYTDSDNDQSESDNEFTYIYSKSDTENDSDSPEIPMEDSTEIPMEVQATVVQSILPFTGVSTEWYVLQNRLAKHNSSRDTIHQAITVEKDDDGLISYVNRSEVEGTIERIVADLHKQISSASQTKRNHLEAILLVGKHFLSTDR